MRYFLEIAYNGTNYHGWQIQDNANTVQQELNTALKKLFRKKIETTGSGRTDTGVHAEQQFVHFDLDEKLTKDHLFKLNQILPWDINIKRIIRVKQYSSARFDATLRTYEYRISQVKNPFLQDFSYYLRKELDLKKMNKAALMLLKHDDFESFSKVHTSVDHFLCEVNHAEWIKKNDLVIFKIEANRFLRGMVRALVGTMLEVGFGKISLKEFQNIIVNKNRRLAGRSVPPEGLFLTKIKYPKSVFLK